MILTKLLIQNIKIFKLDQLNLILDLEKIWLRFLKGQNIQSYSELPSFSLRFYSTLKYPKFP